VTIVAVARKVTSMKAMAAVVAVGAGERVNVSKVCADVGVSRKTFYKWVARYRAEGLDGLEERSRRPKRTPGQTATHVEEHIVRLRKELADAGLDHGATTIQWHLGRRKAELDGQRVPSVATIHRILVRRGLVTPSPSKRPKSSWCRFEAPAPNEWWQIDATGWVVATGAVEVFNVLDDHSRVVARSRAVATASGEEAWTTFSEAAQRWGFPPGACPTTDCASPASCAATRCCSSSDCAPPACAPSPAAPTTPRPPAK
jgi:transposase